MADDGCHVGNKLYGRFSYAESVIILTPSLCGLQNMLNTTCECIHLKFNPAKLSCILLSTKKIMTSHQCF